MSKPNRKQVALNFNFDDPHEKSIYDFYAKQTSNLSGLMKNVLFLYKEMKERQEANLALAKDEGL